MLDLNSNAVSITETIFNNENSITNKTKLLEEMNLEFTSDEQRIFAINYYMYLDYHQTNDYVVDLDKIYKQLGFSRKDPAKRILEKNFTEDIDYKILFHPSVEKSTGRPVEQIMLNVDTFKNLCMLAQTKEAKQIRRYYVKLENVVNKMIKKSLGDSRILFNQDQINNSNRLIEHFGNKKDVIYMFSFNYMEELYAKFGIVGELREFHKRVVEHQKEFGDICFHLVMKCSNVCKIESEFKNTSMYSLNKAKIPKKYCGFHVEVLKLSEILTTENIRQEMIKIAGNRILDPPPEYSENNSNSNSIDLEIEKERTNQEQERTKRQQIKFEMLKLSLNKNTTRTTEIVDDLINFEEVVVPQRQPVILEHISQEEEEFETEKHKFYGGKPIYSSEFYQNGQCGPLNCRQMYLESIKYVEHHVHELFYSDNKSNYLCRSNFYSLNEKKEWEFRNKFEILVIISIYIHRIVKNLVNIYEQILTDEDLKYCEKLCNSKNLCFSTFDEIKHLYFKTVSRIDYMYYDEKIHKQGKLPEGRLHIKYKPFPVHFERKRYLQFIYENITFTDDNQWPIWSFVVERYMKFEKVFYFKKDLQEIKLLLTTLCSGCILN